MDISLSYKDLHEFYSEYFYYYRTLDVFWQKKFRERCMHFMDVKVISGRDGFTVNNKVKAIVAASAVQLTLGLETWDYDYFYEIIIHPKAYTNEATKQQFKGETNLQGYIRLSWLSFINGYKNNNDNVNLGIHEFSHALRFNGIRGNEEDYHLKYFFLQWLSTAYEAHYQLKKGKESIFRSYGGTNINEFISVCFEHYFESPEDIKVHYPHLFYNTAILLNQFTVNDKTGLNIREQMIREKNTLMSPLNEQTIKQDVFSSSSIPLICISLFLLAITAANTGIFSGPSLILAIVMLAFYLRLELQHISVSVFNNEIRIHKGLFFFKDWSCKTILLSQLVKLQYTESETITDLSLIYYNLEDKHFYEESMECSSIEVQNVMNELKSNRVAIHRI